MTEADLLRMLALDGGNPAAQEVVKTVMETRLETGTSAYALELDAWDIARGKKILQENARPEVRQNVSPEAMADFHSVGFQLDPQLTKGCSDKRRAEYVKTLLESPQCQNLRASTRLNELASKIAAHQFGGEYAQLVGKDKARENKRKDKPPKNPKEEQREQRKAESDLRRAATRGLRQAQEEVEEAEGMMAALGCGPGGPGGKLSGEELAKLFQKVRNSHVLRRICELAGRYRRVMHSKQRRKTHHGMDDLVGICLDDDLGKILSEEAAMLLVPEFELDTLRRLVERETLALEYRGVEPVGKGPIIVCVDESGSMSGEPIANAKAFALTMADLARRTKRFVALVGYSGGTEGTLCVLPPNRWDQGKLCDWLTHFFSGGTELDVPLRELPTKFWPEIVAAGAKPKQTDLILLTDAICHLPAAIKDPFLAWKKANQVRLITLIIGQRTAGDLASVSDEVHLLSTVSADAEGIGNCLSI